MVLSWTGSSPADASNSSECKRRMHRQCDRHGLYMDRGTPSVAIPGHICITTEVKARVTRTGGRASIGLAFRIYRKNLNLLGHCSYIPNSKLHESMIELHGKKEVEQHE